MRIVNIKKWAYPPRAGEMFRVGSDAYKCYFVLWGYALIKFHHTMKWEW